MCILPAACCHSTRSLRWPHAPLGARAAKQALCRAPARASARDSWQLHGGRCRTTPGCPPSGTDPRPHLCRCHILRIEPGLAAKGPLLLRGRGACGCGVMLACSGAHGAQRAHQHARCRSLLHSCFPGPRPLDHDAGDPPHLCEALGPLGEPPPRRLGAGLVHGDHAPGRASPASFWCRSLGLMVLASC